MTSLHADNQRVDDSDGDNGGAADVSCCTTLNRIARTRHFQLAAFCLGVVIGGIIVASLLPSIIGPAYQLISAIQPTPINALIAFVVVFVAASPIAVGYTAVVVAVAFIFRWYALPVVYAASVLGGLVWFTLARHCGAECGWSLNTFPYYREHVAAVERAVADSGWKSAAVIQLSALPFGLVTATLALTGLSSRDYLVAALISRSKLVNYVWLGTSTSDIAALYNTSSASLYQPANIVILAISVTASVGSLILITVLTRRQLSRYNHRDMDDVTDTDAERDGRALLSGEPSTTAPAPIRGYLSFQSEFYAYNHPKHSRPSEYQPHQHNIPASHVVGIKHTAAHSAAHLYGDGTGNSSPSSSPPLGAHILTETTDTRRRSPNTTIPVSASPSIEPR